MEDYNLNQLGENNNNSNNNNTATRANFLYASPVLAQNNNNSSVYNRTSSGSNITSQQQHHHQPQLHMNNVSGSFCFDLQSSDHGHPAVVKIEGSASRNHHGSHKFQYPFRGNQTIQTSHHHQQQVQIINNESSSDVEAIKAKIIAHPQYSNLLEAYMDCHKVTKKNFSNFEHPFSIL